MGVIVALSSSPDYTAQGSLFWDDGESFGDFNSLYYVLVYLEEDIKI